jgi:hypothetical protein
MVEQEEPGRDLAGLVVPFADRLFATGTGGSLTGWSMRMGCPSVLPGRISVTFRRRGGRS